MNIQSAQFPSTTRLLLASAALGLAGNARAYQADQYLSDADGENLGMPRNEPLLQRSLATHNEPQIRRVA